jgi:hypothetical protein
MMRKYHVRFLEEGGEETLSPYSADEDDKSQTPLKYSDDIVDIMFQHDPTYTTRRFSPSRSALPRSSSPPDGLYIDIVRRSRS